MNAPIVVNPKILSSRYEGTTERWWKTRLPELVSAGVAGRRGRNYYTRLEAVDEWLLSPSKRQGGRR